MFSGGNDTYCEFEFNEIEESPNAEGEPVAIGGLPWIDAEESQLALA